MDFGDYGPYITASYAAVVLALGGLIAWLVADGRRQARELAELSESADRSASGPRES